MIQYVTYLEFWMAIYNLIPFLYYSQSLFESHAKGATCIIHMLILCLLLWTTSIWFEGAVMASWRFQDAFRGLGFVHSLADYFQVQKNVKNSKWRVGLKGVNTLFRFGHGGKWPGREKFRTASIYTCLLKMFTIWTFTVETLNWMN